MSSDYEKLKKLYDRIDILKEPYSPEFSEWQTKVELYLSNIFGNESNEVKAFKKIHFSSGFWLDDETETKYCLEGLQVAKGLFEDYLEDAKMKNNSVSSVANNKNVFIVHGHADDLKYQVSNLLRTIKLNPIILHKKTGSSRTVIEKIEKYGKEASAAIVLFTPDDFGNVKTEAEKNPRARQNVVFEAGYFMGLLGRDRVLLVVSDKSIELPGDLSGVVYSETSESDIAKELKAMGLDVDLNDLM